MDVVRVAGRDVAKEGYEARRTFKVKVYAEICQSLKNVEDSLFVDFQVVLFKFLDRFHQKLN